MILCFTILIYYTPGFRDTDGNFSVAYYVIYFVINMVNSILTFIVFVCVGTFYAQISDSNMGGKLV